MLPMSDCFPRMRTENTRPDCVKLTQIINNPIVPIRSLNIDYLNLKFGVTKYFNII